MTPDMLPTLALSTMGVAVGVFVGALIGINISTRNSGVNPDWLFRGSVYATAFLASMAAWFVAILLKGLLG